MEELTVTIAVVVFNEEQNIGACLGSLLKQKIDTRYEIIVVDNDSTDSTPGIIRQYSSGHDNIRLLNNPVRKISKSRQMAVAASGARFIAFTDADCIVPDNWLKVLLDGYAKYAKQYPKLAAVGGSNIFPEKRNRFQEAAGIVLNSFWGSHTSTQGRIYLKDRLVKHIPTVNILYDRQAILDSGGFDEEFGSICEDVELNHRLSGVGYQFVFLKDSFLWHNFASTFLGWIKKVFIYGAGRARVIKKHPTHFSLKFLIPPVLLILLFLSLLLVGRHKTFFIPLIYFIFIFLISIWECVKHKKAKLVFLVFALYIATHLSYGCGEFYGLFKKRK